jgi:hypothetical protein
LPRQARDRRERRTTQGEKRAFLQDALSVVQALHDVRQTHPLPHFTRQAARDKHRESTQSLKKMRCSQAREYNMDGHSSPACDKQVAQVVRACRKHE